MVDPQRFESDQIEIPQLAVRDFAPTECVRLCLVVAVEFHDEPLADATLHVVPREHDLVVEWYILGRVQRRDWLALRRVEDMVTQVSIDLGEGAHAVIMVGAVPTIHHILDDPVTNFFRSPRTCLVTPRTSLMTPQRSPTTVRCHQPEKDIVFSFFQSIHKSHPLLMMVLSAVTLTFGAALLWGTQPLDVLGSILDWLTLTEVASSLRALEINPLPHLAFVPFGVAALITFVWLVDVVREGEVRPNMMPSRRASLMALALVILSPDITALVWLSAAACAIPAVATLVARFGVQAALEVFLFRVGDMVMSAFAVVLYPVLWLTARR